MPEDIRLAEPIFDKMDLKLTLLGNGLPTCKIIVINSKNGNSEECVALVDTGAQFSILSKEVALKLDCTVDGEIDLMPRDGVSEKIERSYLEVRFYNGNWPPAIQCKMGIINMSNRSDYQALIGVDLLKNFVFTYDGDQGIASLRY